MVDLHQQTDLDGEVADGRVPLVWPVEGVRNVGVFKVTRAGNLADKPTSNKPMPKANTFFPCGAKPFLDEPGHRTAACKMFGLSTGKKPSQDPGRGKEGLCQSLMLI